MEGSDALGTRLILLLVAMFFALASTFKVVDPRPLIRVLDHIFGPLARLDILIAGAGFIVAWEIWLVGGLLLARERRTRSVALLACFATVIVFTGVLGVLFFDPDAPGCGCLGELRHVFEERARVEAGFGIARNVAILWLLCVLWRRWR